MGISLVLQCGARSWKRRVDSDTAEVFRILRTHRKDQVNLLFIADPLAEPQVISLNAAREAASELRRFIHENRNVLPLMYEAKVSRFPGNVLTPMFGTGSMSGVHIAGDDQNYYQIRTGYDLCEMVKYSRSDSGDSLVYFDRQDLRNVDSIETLNLGTVVFRKSQTYSSWKKVIDKLCVFLSECGQDNILKYLE
jgi:hypothetical protein